MQRPRARFLMLFKGLPVLSLVAVQLFHPAHAADIRDQLNVQTGKAILYVTDLPPQQVAEQVREAVSQFAIPANVNFNPMPSPLPARPSSPVEKQIYLQGAPVKDYACEGAYAEITKTPPAVQNAFYFNREGLRLCLFAYQGGVKVEMLFHVIRKTDSLTGGLFNGITKAIRGSDGDRITGQLGENIREIKKLIPGALVARIEAPGLPVQEPDKAAVDPLLAALPADTVPDARPAARTVAAAPVPAAPAAAAGVDLSLIGARKELAAMGFKFYDQDQFVDAARRGDFLTVRLFLAAGGIRPGAPDSKGETALDLAKDGTEMKFWVSAMAEAEKQGQYPGKIAEAALSR